jgi:hypothetical protein
MARKARVEDLGHAMTPAPNGDGAVHQETRIPPFQQEIPSSFPPIAEYAFLPRKSTPAAAATSATSPKAFSHLALINAVMHVIRAEAGESQQFTGVTPRPSP